MYFYLSQTHSYLKEFNRMIIILSQHCPSLNKVIVISKGREALGKFVTRVMLMDQNFRFNETMMPLHNYVLLLFIIQV